MARWVRAEGWDGWLDTEGEFHPLSGKVTYKLGKKEFGPDRDFHLTELARAQNPLTQRKWII